MTEITAVGQIQRLFDHIKWAGARVLVALSERTDQHFHALIQTLDDTALEQPVHYRNSAGREFDTTLVDILLHVALHGSYRRGQVTAAMRASDDAPESTDYVAFVPGAPAAKTAPPASDMHSR